MQARFDAKREKKVGQAERQSDSEKGKGQKVNNSNVKQGPADKERQDDKEQDRELALFNCSELVVLNQVDLFEQGQQQHGYDLSADKYDEKNDVLLLFDHVLGAQVEVEKRAQK